MKMIKSAAVALVALVAGLVLTGTSTAQPDLRGWDYSQTRTAGHYAVVGDDLHVWTDDATSNAKVAGYHYARGVLGDVGQNDTSMGLTWAGTTPAPGYQLVITVAGKSRILVHEDVYGVNWWMSDSGCDTWCDTLAIPWAGGGGSSHSAQLVQWANAAPDAQVTGFGFSLGSGVKGDGTITDIRYLNKSYGFKSFVPPTHTTAVSTTQPTTTTIPTPPSSTISTPVPPTQGGTGTPSVPTVGTLNGGGNAVPINRTATLNPGKTAYVNESADLAYTGTSDSLKWLLVGGVGLVLIGGAIVTVLTIRRNQARQDEGPRTTD